MKITYLPPQETPDWARQYTATTPEMLWRLRDGRVDLTIDQRVLGMWSPKPLGPNLEDQLTQMLETLRKEK